MPSRRTEGRVVCAYIVCGLALAAAGCGRQNVHAARPVTALPAPPTAETERPMNTAPDTNASPPVETVTPPPVIPDTGTVPPPVDLPHGKTGPKPPRSTPEPAPPADQPAHPSAPQISPQLSAGDQASYERKTNEDLAVAEKNLQQADGKQLSAAQNDLVEKIRIFLTQSHEAAKAGDLARAQNLAQKARLLSVELVESL